MPADNIKRAIMKGTGELEGGQLEEITYEGYGPGGVALLAEVVTDNRNRTVSEIRHVFSKNGGNMAEAGAVSWMFSKKGYIVIEESQGRRRYGHGSGDRSGRRRFRPRRRDITRSIRRPMLLTAC